MVADNLENSYYVEFPSKGHSIDIGGDCGFVIKNSFLRDPWSAPDTSCMADEPPPTFILPDEIVPLDGFELSLEDIDFGVPERGQLGLEVFAGVSLGLYLTEILVFLVLSVVMVAGWSERKKKIKSFGYQQHVIAAVIGVLSISTVLLISELNQQYVWSNELLNEIGYFQTSPVVTTLGAIVLAQMIFCLALSLQMIQFWRKKQSHLVNRIFLTLLLLAGISFWFFYIRWDLIGMLFL